MQFHHSFSHTKNPKTTKTQLLPSPTPSAHIVYIFCGGAIITPPLLSSCPPPNYHLQSNPVTTQRRRLGSLSHHSPQLLNESELLIIPASQDVFFIVVTTKEENIFRRSKLCWFGSNQKLQIRSDSPYSCWEPHIEYSTHTQNEVAISLCFGILCLSGDWSDERWVLIRINRIDFLYVYVENFFVERQLSEFML